MQNKEPIILKSEGKIAHIILDNPPDNRMNRYFFTSLKRVVDELKELEHINAVVLYSSSRHFSAGADVEDITRSVYDSYTRGENVNDVVKGYASILLDLERLSVPVIAAVTGFCTGSGLELALASTIRICSTDALLGCPELGWGIITGLNGSIRLEKAAGAARAKEIILKSDMIKAQDACKMGVVDKVMNRKEVLPYALNLAEKLSGYNRTVVKKIISISYSKQMKCAL